MPRTCANSERCSSTTADHASSRPPGERLDRGQALDLSIVCA
jgi:hypothetical protein